jgi:hypothetical protein
MDQEQIVEKPDPLVVEVYVAQEDRDRIWENDTDIYRRRMSVQICRRILFGLIPVQSLTCWVGEAISVTSTTSKGRTSLRPLQKGVLS